MTNNKNFILIKLKYFNKIKLKLLLFHNLFIQRCFLFSVQNISWK